MTDGISLLRRGSFHVKSMAEVELETIRHAVSYYGTASEAAKRLGIGRSTLYRKLGDK